MISLMRFFSAGRNGTAAQDALSKEFVDRVLRDVIERERHHGTNDMLPRSVPAVECDCDMSSGHFVRLHMFRKILISACEWSHGYEGSEWSLVTSLMRLFCCP